jgi:hypothetical protein
LRGTLLARCVGKRGAYRSRYAVAIDPETRKIVDRGEAPPGLLLDFDAIMDA